MANFSITSILIFSISIVLISFLKFSFAQKTYYTNTSCIAREKRALLQFRNSLIDESNRLSSWFGQEEDCCNWEGIGCDKNTGHIVKLDLRSKSNYYTNQGKLQGEINSSLCALKHLTYLDLSVNNFSGIQIPVFLGSLKNLKYLNLSLSGFNGKIPHELGNLSNLQHLDLSWQWVVGYNLTTNTFLWVTKLSSLQSLDLSSVYFNGSQDSQEQDWFQVITRLPNLRILKLRFCGLGFLSKSVDFVTPLANKTSLTSLDLGWNYLYSPLPVWLFNMTSLEYLDLGFNYFYGLVSVKISELTSLTFLNLEQNNFEGFLPIEPLCNLSNSLRVLNLGINGFQGSIPKEIVCFEKLDQLILGSNELNDTIDSDIGLLSNLEILDISNNPMICGEISELHLKLEDSAYEDYYASEQSFSFMGRREIMFHSLPVGLKSLDLSNNYIVGEIPNQLMELVELQSLNLSRNQLAGNIPEKIGNLTEILSLDLSMNQLSGSIPQSLGNLNFLSHLNLSSNQLSGRIPTGNQLQTLNDPSIYAGNKGLCGKPLPIACSDEKARNHENNYDKEEKEFDFSWFYSGLGPGFAFGHLLIFCIFLFKKSWRIALFQLVENFAAYVY